MMIRSTIEECEGPEHPEVSILLSDTTDSFSGAMDGMDPGATLWLRAIGGVCRVHGSSCRSDGRLSQVGAVLPLPILHPHHMRTLPLRSQVLHTPPSR